MEAEQPRGLIGELVIGEIDGIYHLQPIFAAVGAMLVLGEEINGRTMSCGAIVLFGVRAPRR